MARRLLRIAALTAPCFIFWMILAQDLRAPSLAGAVVLAVAAAAWSAPVFYEQHPLRAALALYRVDLLILFFVTVLLQSYAAAFELIWRMLTGRYHPGIVRLRTRLRSGLGRAVLANTISLVPGTLSLWLDDNHLYVHWFDLKTTHALKAGDQIKKRIEHYLERIFG